MNIDKVKLKNVKTLWLLLFTDGVLLSQVYRVTLRRQFAFYHSIPWSCWYSNDHPWKDESLS